MCLTCQESEDAKLPIKLLLQLLEAANTAAAAAEAAGSKARARAAAAAALAGHQRRQRAAGAGSDSKAFFEDSMLMHALCMSAKSAARSIKP
jgi:hypothetical protein